MIKLVAVDFDDTLSLTEYACFLLENQVAVEMGHRPMTRAAHKKNWGKELELAIQERVPGIDTEKFIKRLYDVHEEAVVRGEIDVVPESNIEALDKVLSHNLKLALLTSRSIDEARHLMHETHPLNTRIERFYYKENSDFLKPDPRVFDKILSDFNVKPHEAIYIGDAPGDVLSSKGAGLHFVAVLESGVRSKKDFKNLQVDYFATTFPEAINYILSIS